MREGVAIGAVQLRRTEAHLFTERQIALLETFADQAVIAIENVRLFKELEARPRSHETLSSRRRRRDPQVISALADRRAAGVRHDRRAGAAAVRRRRRCRAEVRRQATSSGRVRATSSPEGQSALRSAVPPEPRERRGPSDPDAGDRTRRGRPSRTRTIRMRKSGAAGGIRSVLAVPMLREGRPVGVITVGRPQPGPVLGAADRAPPDLRRPGGDRHRERAPVHGAGGAQRRAEGGARAADGDQRDPARHLALAHGRAAGVRRDRAERAPALRGHLQRRLSRRGRPAHARRRARRGRGGDRRHSQGVPAPHCPRHHDRTRGPGSTRRAHRGHAARPRVHPSAARYDRPAIRSHRPHLSRGAPHRRGERLARRGETLHRQADRAAPDLRRPGGDRHRERAPVQRSWRRATAI